MEIEEQKRKESLKNSIKDGSAYAVMDSSAVSYITPFALALNANNSFIGLVSSLPGLIGSFFQLFSTKLMEKISRKRIVTTYALLQALVWLPIAFIAFLDSRYALPLLLFLYILLVSFGAVIQPAWNSWMRDLVHGTKSGAYFGRRNRICGIVGLIALFLAGIMLDFYKKVNLVMVGFSTLFIIGFFSRGISRKFLAKQYEPEFKQKKEDYFSFLSFLKKMHKNNFGRFTIYVALFQFAVNIAAPFFSVYMLKDLRFSYLMFTTLNIGLSASTFLSMPLWGKFADKFGNLSALRIASMFIPFIPFLWILNHNFVFLFFVQLLSGFFWAAFNLSALNFIYDSVSRERMGICVSYFNVLNTAGVFLGAFLGGIVSTHIMTAWKPAIFIFFISGMLRLVMAFAILPILKEVRLVEKFELRKNIRHLRFSNIRNLFQ